MWVTSSLTSLLVVLFFANMAVMLGVGARLLLAAARNRRVPEAAIGSSMAFGALGVLLGLVSTTILERDPDAFALWSAGRVAQAIGTSGLVIGCWRIFRPDDSWAAAVAAMTCAVALTGCAMRSFTGSIPAPGDGTPGGLLSAVSSLIVYGWTGTEALRYHRQLTRRVRLGLADPFLAHRFGLWALSGALALATTLAGTFYTYVLGQALSSSPIPFIAMQVALFVAAICLWLAFYPPDLYRRRLVSDA